MDNNNKDTVAATPSENQQQDSNNTIISNEDAVMNEPNNASILNKRKWDDTMGAGEGDDESEQTSLKKQKMTTSEETNATNVSHTAAATVDHKEEKQGEDETTTITTKKEQKKKVALIIGYDGSKYSGLQTNPLVTTVEDVLFQAIVQAGGVAQENAELKKVAWGRSSRTDKGVHAILNVICLKMMLLPDIVQKINEQLTQIIAERNLSPIMVYDYLRVTSSFDPKRSCDGRKYRYVLPTYAFEQIDKLTDVQVPQTNTFTKLDDQMASVSMEELIKSRSYIEGYRISEERLQKARYLFSKYLGTKCYHNFTQRSKTTSAAATMRYITSFTVGEPFASEELGGVEHVVLTVEGQSFVLNQIRKMIGFVVTIMRGHIAESDFDVALDKNQRYYVPMAPGTGLLLDELYFEHYNAKFASVHGGFDWNREDLRPRIADFKQSVINSIVKRERQDLIMARWLYVLPRTCQTDLLQPGIVRIRPAPENDVDNNISNKKGKKKDNWKKKRNNKKKKNNNNSNKESGTTVSQTECNVNQSGESNIAAATSSPITTSDIKTNVEQSTSAVATTAPSSPDNVSA